MPDVKLHSTKTLFGGRWQVTLGDTIWHESSHSSEVFVNFYRCLLYTLLWTTKRFS